MNITYPQGGGGPWPVRKDEAKSDDVFHVVALCDGSTTLIAHGRGAIDAITEANAAAADRLVDRIAKHVVEMQKSALPEDIRRAVAVGKVFEPTGAWQVRHETIVPVVQSKEISAAIDKAVNEGLRNVRRNFARFARQSEARGL
jgi:hypothetical protein